MNQGAVICGLVLPMHIEMEQEDLLRKGGYHERHLYQLSTGR
jgi:hypothetical protein